MNGQKNFMRWDKPKSVLITGASSGIGKAFAYELANQGFRVILVARREKKLKHVANELQDKSSKEIEVIIADLTEEEGREKVAKRINEQDDIDVLVNNAGFGTKGYFSNTDVKKQHDMMLVHNITPVYFCRVVLPGMIERGRGVIINVSSLAALMPMPQNSLYSATKSFLNVFTEVLALELRGTGVCIQALCPGFTISEFHSKGDFEGFDRSLVPKKMWMTAEETALKSLEAFRKRNVIVIPGKKNRLLVWLWNRPILGKPLRRRFK